MTHVEFWCCHRAHQETSLRLSLLICKMGGDNNTCSLFWSRLLKAEIINTVEESEHESRSIISNSLWLYSPWNSLGLITRVGSLSLLKGVFPTQGSNPGLPHCRRILYRLSHQGSPVDSRHSQRLQPAHCIFFWGEGICEPILALPSPHGFPYFPTSISQASKDLLKCHHET